MRESQHAPGRLELVREFVNTSDVEEGTDVLANVAGADAWLRSHNLLGAAGTRLGGGDRDRLVSAREALRALLLASNQGEAAPEEALAALNRSAEGAALGLRFDGEGAELHSAGRGTDAALGQILSVVYAAMQDGSWQRLKACPAEDCQWAFYDRSRNRSATWCQMGECGNRSKARAFRARRRKQGGGG